jgi:putative GTP pyrophosphokinase
MVIVGIITGFFMEIQRWKEILSPYDLAVKELDVKFNHLIMENRNIGRYSYVERVETRRKTIASIIEKCKRKGIPVESAVDVLTDIAGIRLICQFEEDIERVAEEIRKRPDMVVLEEKNYLQDVKDSGYRSYHMIVQYEVYTVYGSRAIPIEIQIRTMAMNFWATIEHSLHYKYNGNVPEEVKAKLRASSDAVLQMDQEMSSIREDIVTAQELFYIKATLVKDINNSINNLYNFEDRAAVLNIQQEFMELYKIGTLDELKEFQRKLDAVAARHGAQEA